MNRFVIALLAAAAVGVPLALVSTPAHATECVYGTWRDDASGTTYYVWFHEGEFVGMTPNPSPPPACQPH